MVLGVWEGNGHCIIMDSKGMKMIRYMLPSVEEEESSAVVIFHAKH